VLLHPQSSASVKAGQKRLKSWQKRAESEAKEGKKRKRTTFFAPQYSLQEPLLKKFIHYMESECANTSKDFVDVRGATFVMLYRAGVRMVISCFCCADR
jgi:hypothetical protein